jgi:hypothetical protein
MILSEQRVETDWSHWVILFAFQSRHSFAPTVLADWWNNPSHCNASLKLTCSRHHSKQFKNVQHIFRSVIIIDECSFCWILFDIVFISRADNAFHCWAATFIECRKLDCSKIIEAHELHGTMTTMTSTLHWRMVSYTQTINNSIQLGHWIQCEIAYSMLSRKTWWSEACKTHWTSHTLWIHPHTNVICHASSNFDTILCLSPSSYVTHTIKIFNRNEKQISVKHQRLTSDGEFSCGTVKALRVTRTHCTSTSTWSSMFIEFIITSLQRLYVHLPFSACSSFRPEVAKLCCGFCYHLTSNYPVPIKWVKQLDTCRQLYPS